MKTSEGLRWSFPNWPVSWNVINNCSVLKPQWNTDVWITLPMLMAFYYSSFLIRKDSLCLKAQLEISLGFIFFFPVEKQNITFPTVRLVWHDRFRTFWNVDYFEVNEKEEKFPAVLKFGHSDSKSDIKE